MDPVSLVVSALASGELVQKAAPSGVLEAYGLLRSRFLSAVDSPNSEQCLASLLEDPDAHTVAARVLISDSGSFDTDDVQAAAREVHDWVSSWRTPWDGPDLLAGGKANPPPADQPETSIGSDEFQDSDGFRGASPPGPNTGEDDDPPWSR